MEDHHSISQWLANIAGTSAIAASLIGWLPTIASLVAGVTAFIWYAIQISESATVQRWRATRRTRKLARLKAHVLLLEAQMKPPLPGPDTGGSALH